MDAALLAIGALHSGVSRKRESDADDAALAHHLARLDRRPGDAARRQARSQFLPPHQCFFRTAVFGCGNRGVAALMGKMRERVVFWYGCNRVARGDILHSPVEPLPPVGIDTDSRGG